MTSHKEDSSTTNVVWKTVVHRHKPEFIWLRFMPLNGCYYSVMIPTARFSEMLESGVRASIPLAALHAMRNDHIAGEKFVPGVLHLQPDLCSAYTPSGLGPGERMAIMTSFVEKDGGASASCPRTQLANLSDKLLTEHNLAILFGFEVEVVFMRLVAAQSSPDIKFAEVGHNSWCRVAVEDAEIFQMVEDVVRALGRADAAVEKFHAESAPGQWEFVLSPRKPVEAVDMLLRARETITNIAQQHGFRATLHPRPYSDHAGTGAHTHISATPLDPTEFDIQKVESFFAGILHHLPALAAFAMPLDVSYFRVGSGMWSGGEWVCWGWENRETPMRRITTNRFELKLMCGTANPYLTLAALLVAALDGVERQLSLVAGDCKAEAARLSASERSQLQITAKLPININESLDKLQADLALGRGLGTGLIETYVAVTKAWNKVLRQMEPRERENWIIGHY